MSMKNPLTQPGINSCSTSGNMKRLQYQKRGDKNFEEFFQQNTEGETIPESMEATYVLSLKGRGKEVAWPAIEVLGKVFCYIVAVRFVGGLSYCALSNRCRLCI